MFIISWEIHTPKTSKKNGKAPQSERNYGEGRKEEEYTLFSHDPSDH